MPAARQARTGRVPHLCTHLARNLLHAQERAAFFFPETVPFICKPPTRPGMTTTFQTRKTAVTLSTSPT